MKVCILSMQSVNNYGSLLQAYSLKKMVETAGHRVEFLEIERGEDESLNQQCHDLSPAPGNHLTGLRFQLYRVRMKLSNREMKRKFRDFRIRHLGMGTDMSNRHYDLCIIGSDEVFHCLQRAKWGFSTQLFGDVKNADHVITYAACCGETREDALSPAMRKAVTGAMQRLEGISVRDENTADFVRKLTGNQAEYHLDPVAVGDFREEIRESDLKGKLPKRFCLVYSYRNRMEDERIRRAVTDYCKKHDLVPVAPYGAQNWIKAGKALTPFELLKAFEKAECIVTDTFHGTLFGAKYAEKMAVIIRDSNRNKLKDLTKRLGIEDHVLSDPSRLKDVLEVPLNRSEIDRILAEAREKSLKYLKMHLSEIDRRNEAAHE